MKLELKHIAPYLPYGLIVKHNDEDTLLTDLHVSGIINPVKYEAGITSVIDVDEVKPILRPNGDLFKDEVYITSLCNLIADCSGEFDKITIGNYIATCIDGKEIVHIDWRGGTPTYSCDGNVYGFPYKAYEWLFKHHFDIFGLIDKGLAVSK